MRPELKAGLIAAGVERSGIFDIAKISGGADQPLPQVKTYRDSASDHGAVWADFNV